MTVKMKFRRDEMGLSQAGLGRLSGVPRSRISEMETLKLMAYGSAARKLGRVLGLQPSELQESVFRGDNDESRSRR